MGRAPFVAVQSSDVKAAELLAALLVPRAQHTQAERLAATGFQQAAPQLHAVSSHPKGHRKARTCPSERPPGEGP